MIKPTLSHVFLFFLFLESIIPTRNYCQSVNQLALSGRWKLTWNDGNHGPQTIEDYCAINPSYDTLRYMDVDVPMDIITSLQNKGIISDINYGMNYLTARWVAEHYWHYYRYFNVPKEVCDKSTFLKFERLDYSAIIFLNGIPVGKHDNAFIPCFIDVTGKLQEGRNIIAVGIESGLYDAANKSVKDYNDRLNVYLNKRHWLRKPQYQFSWDWNPQLINIGITGDVSLIWYNEARIDNIVPLIKMSDDLSVSEIIVRTFIERTGSKKDFLIECTLSEQNQKVSKEITVKEGVNPYELKILVQKPKLWWPAGHGSQNLYTLRIDLKKDGKIIDSDTKKIGFRKIEVDQSKHPVAGNYFIIRVNNRPIFMKGANLVPADMIYSNVDSKILNRLVDMAIGANFNMLRIWGGGLFAGNDLLRLCDEKGILIWHDFLFACSEYPGDDIAFFNNVKREVIWAVREYAYHPSLIVWCGNNELEWGTWDWGYKFSGKVVPDYIIYHHLIPVIMKEEDPYRFYWPSSPFSENNEFPNSPITGDQHPWGVTLQRDSTNLWAYRDYIDRFPNEGGVLGASSPATLRQFLPPDEQYIRSFSWDLHDNSKNFETSGLGVTYRFVEEWLGKDYLKMSLDEYAFASALIQSEGLSEYINNYHRRMYSSSSAIFWMFNDSWPVTHGWTIIDYYFRKKLAYHPVRRAFEPINIVVFEDGDKISICGINEKQFSWKGKLQYGLFETAGSLTVNNTKNIVLPPNSSKIVASFEKKELKEAGINNHGAFALLKENDKIVSQHRLFLVKFKDLILPQPQIAVKQSKDKVIITSPVYVWGLCLDINGESDIPDNCFDILPGIPYLIDGYNLKKVEVKMTGNDLVNNKLTNINAK